MKQPPAGWTKTSAYSIARGSVSIAGYRGADGMAWGIFIGRAIVCFMPKFSDALAFAEALPEAKAAA